MVYISYFIDGGSQLNADGKFTNVQAGHHVIVKKRNYIDGARELNALAFTITKTSDVTVANPTDTSNIITITMNNHDK